MYKIVGFDCEKETVTILRCHPASEISIWTKVKYITCFGRFYEYGHVLYLCKGVFPFDSRKYYVDKYLKRHRVVQ